MVILKPLIFKIIKNATIDMKTLGCNWDEEIIEVADSLFYQRIPIIWCILSGTNYSFQNYGVATFLADLKTRFEHVEKCLTNVIYYCLF